MAEALEGAARASELMGDRIALAGMVRLALGKEFPPRVRPARQSRRIPRRPWRVAEAHLRLRLRWQNSSAAVRSSGGRSPRTRVRIVLRILSERESHRLRRAGCSLCRRGHRKWRLRHRWRCQRHGSKVWASPLGRRPRLRGEGRRIERPGGLPGRPGRPEADRQPPAQRAEQAARQPW
jgi:hypothetical protein